MAVGRSVGLSVPVAVNVGSVVTVSVGVGVALGNAVTVGSSVGVSVGNNVGVGGSEVRVAVGDSGVSVGGSGVSVTVGSSTVGEGITDVSVGGTGVTSYAAVEMTKTDNRSSMKSIAGRFIDFPSPMYSMISGTIGTLQRARHKTTLPFNVTDTCNFWC